MAKKLQGRELATLHVQVADAGEEFVKSVRHMQDRKVRLLAAVGRAVGSGITIQQLKVLLPGVTAAALQDLAQEAQIIAEQRERDEGLKKMGEDTQRRERARARSKAAPK